MIVNMCEEDYNELCKKYKMEVCKLEIIEALERTEPSINQLYSIEELAEDIFNHKYMDRAFYELSETADEIIESILNKETV